MRAEGGGRRRGGGLGWGAARGRGGGGQVPGESACQRRLLPRKRSASLTTARAQHPCTMPANMRAWPHCYVGGPP